MKVIIMKKKKNIGLRRHYETSRNQYEDYLPDLDPPVLSGTKKRMKLRLWYLLLVLLDDLIGSSSLYSYELFMLRYEPPHHFCQDRLVLVVYMYAMMIYLYLVSTYLWAIDNIPVSDEVLVQTVQLHVNSAHTTKEVTHLLHLLGGELKVKDFGITNDPLFRYWFGDDDVSLHISWADGRRKVDVHVANPTWGRSGLETFLGPLLLFELKGDRTSLLSLKVPMPIISFISRVQASREGRTYLKENTIILADLDDIRMPHKRM
jgi:hypothetical protein